MMIAMETTRTTDIATPAQRFALRRNQQQRLRDQAEALLRAYESLEPPTTASEVQQAGKALLIVGKVLDHVDRLRETDDNLHYGHRKMIQSKPQNKLAELNSWVNILNAGMKELAAARALMREAAG